MVRLLGKTIAKVKLNKGQSLQREKFAEKLTIHGLPLALRSKSWVGRIFWSVIFFSLLGWLINQLSNLLKNTLRSPTVVNLQQKRDNVITLPELTLCAPQTFNVSKLYEDGLSLDITSFMTTTMESAPNSSFRATTDFSAQNLEEKRAEIFKHASSWREFLNKYSITCEDFFVSCKIDWMRFNCCEVFQVLYTPDMGVCFQNKEKAEEMIQTHAGVNGSMEVLLKTPNTLDYWNGGPMWEGITIGIPYLYDPYISMPGQFLLARITATYYVREHSGLACYPRPRRMARDSGCAHTAYNTAIEEVCGCVLYLRIGDVEESLNITLCDPFSKLLCLQTKYGEVMGRYQDLLSQWCSEHLCSEWKFDVALSYAQINRAWVRSVVGELEVDQDYSLLTFYFPALSFQEIMEFYSLTFENMVSSVGGLTGLWLGCSVISVIELIVFGLSLLYAKVYNWISIETDSDSQI